MEYMSEEDFFEIQLGSLLSDVDRKIVMDLYQPILGSSATSLYFRLWNDAEKDGENGFYDLRQFLLCMQMSTSTLLKARKYLEGMGLLKTYLRQQGNHRCFLFVLFAPKYPREFFQDPLLKGFLIKYIGEAAVGKLLLSYQNERDLQDYEELTASFGEVFHPNWNDECFQKMSEIGNLKSRDDGKIQTSFDYGKFFQIWKEKTQLEEDFFVDTELEYISKLASVYGVDEGFMVEALVPSVAFHAPKGMHVQAEHLNKTVQDMVHFHFLDRNPQETTISKKDLPKDTKYAKLLHMMDNMSPHDFLKYRQNNIEPSAPDMQLIRQLSEDFHFSNGVINALLSYVLEIKHNTLPSSYVIKIAGALTREGVKDAFETTNYLKNYHKKQKSRKKNDNAPSRKEDADEVDVEDLIELEDEDGHQD